MCERWAESFADFLCDMGERPSLNYSIERKDNDLGYEPNNCRWATKAEQVRNTSRNILITHQSVTQCMQDWATQIGLHPEALRQRLKRGWSIAKALTAPSGSAGPKLTKEDVLEIRRLRSNGVDRLIVARQFGIHKSMVSLITSGKSWREA